MSISKTAYVDEIVSALTDYSSKLKGLLSDSYTEDKVSAAPGAPVPTAPKDVYSLNEKQFRGYQEAHSRARAKIEEVARKYFSVTADLMCDVPEDAARILGVLNMRSSITGEELDAVIEKYGNRYSAVQAVNDIAKRNGLRNRYGTDTDNAVRLAGIVRDKAEGMLDRGRILSDFDIDMFRSDALNITDNHQSALGKATGKSAI